jgi:hypothetical protein
MPRSEVLVLYPKRPCSATQIAFFGLGRFRYNTRTSGQLSEATSTGGALLINVTPNSQTSELALMQPRLSAKNLSPNPISEPVDTR